MNETTFTVNKEKLHVTTERVFDVPREKVWQAYTDPKCIAEWWGPRKFKTTVEKLENFVGGVWRFVQRDDEGHTVSFNGVCKEFTPPAKLVSTFEYDGAPGHILIQSTTFEDLGGSTKLTTMATYTNRADLEAMVGMGMEWGQRESMERLAELLPKI